MRGNNEKSKEVMTLQFCLRLAQHVISKDFLEF